jgi:hypothetical protein
MPVPDKTTYAAALFERLGEGVVVPIELGEFQQEDGGVWQPQPNLCHENSSQLELRLPGQLQAVRGWLVFDFRAAVPPRLEFMHHSVVRELATGRLFDPTPQVRMQQDYVFIRALEDEPAFEELVVSLAANEKLVYPFGATD